MIDNETESLWSHLLGEAMEGPLTGEVLKQFPSTLTDWETWKSGHPTTTMFVMSRTSKLYTSKLHTPAFGMVIGLANKQESRAWNFPDLLEKGVINDKFDGKSVLVCFDRKSGTAVIFSRELDDRELTFQENEGKLIDRETQTQWDPMTGKALEGMLTGKQLVKLPGIVSLNFAWKTFHPEATFWTRDQK